MAVCEFFRCCYFARSFYYYFYLFKLKIALIYHLIGEGENKIYISIIQQNNVYPTK